MYYSASHTLISNDPGRSREIVEIDHTIAQSYAPDGHGWTDAGRLQSRTRLSAQIVKELVQQYVRANVLIRYEPIICRHCQSEELLDPDEGECAACGNDLTDAQLSGHERLRVVLQPSFPVFDPTRHHGPYKVFLSYRRNESNWLASDLYYAFQRRGHAVFLDDGEIGPGENFETLFTKEASNTPALVALVSKSYFESPYCKLELAHALRAGNRVIPVQVGTDLVRVAPATMPWLATMTKSQVDGSASGLTEPLDEFLTDFVSNPQRSSTNHEYRSAACFYLLEMLGAGDLQRVVNSLDWLSRISVSGSLDDTIRDIRRELGGNTTRLQQLCIALAPRR